jgi:hypothetical protein
MNRPLDDLATSKALYCEPTRNNLSESHFILVFGIGFR